MNTTEFLALCEVVKDATKEERIAAKELVAAQSKWRAANEVYVAAKKTLEDYSKRQMEIHSSVPKE